MRLATETLSTLKRFGVDLGRVTIFVANKEEKFKYELVLQQAKFEIPVVVSCPSLIHSRIWYNKYYEKGSPILNLDDDIHDLYVKDGNGLKTLEKEKGSFDRLVQKGFSVCEKTNARLWGINAVANGMFMKASITVGLRYICGIFHGSFAGDPVLCSPDRVKVSSGEDFETTLKSFGMYKGVVRIDGYSPKTKYFAEGGIQAELGGKSERDADHLKQLKAIVSRYPAYSRLYFKKDSVPNIRLKTITHGKIKWI